MPSTSNRQSLSNHFHGSLSSIFNSIPGLDLSLRSANLPCQKCRALCGSLTICQMSGRDSEAAETDEITGLTDDVDLVRGEVGNLISILF